MGRGSRCGCSCPAPARRVGSAEESSPLSSVTSGDGGVLARESGGNADALSPMTSPHAASMASTSIGHGQKGLDGFCARPTCWRRGMHRPGTILSPDRDRRTPRPESPAAADLRGLDTSVGVVALCAAVRLRPGGGEPVTDRTMRTQRHQALAATADSPAHCSASSSSAYSPRPLA